MFWSVFISGPKFKNGSPGVKNGSPGFKNASPGFKNGRPIVKNGVLGVDFLGSPKHFKQNKRGDLR